MHTSINYMKSFATLCVKIFGWKCLGTAPDLKKYVLIMIPHTSFWDFYFGWAILNSVGIRARFLIKKELFFWPLGSLLRTMGAIPIDRKKTRSVVTFSAELFKEYETLALVITPEGTRSYNDKWKKGFHVVAKSAKVPIVLTYLDYKNKCGGFGPIITPSDEYEKDLEILTEFYKYRHAKHPKQFNLSPEYLDKKV